MKYPLGTELVDDWGVKCKVIKYLESDVFREVRNIPLNPQTLTNQELITAHVDSDNSVIRTFAERLQIEIDNPAVPVVK